MVTREHEALIDLLGNAPGLLLDLLPTAELPADPQAKVIYGPERTTQMPAELYVDRVGKVEFTDGRVLMVLIEVQLRRDDRKKFTWPVYATEVRRQWRHPVALVVWCPDETTASWAREPIQLGPFGTGAPAAVSPRNFPVITDPDQWSGNVGTAVLAALAHQRDRRFPEIAAALLRLLESVEAKQAEIYYDNLAGVLDDSAREILEGTMSTMTPGYKSTFLRTAHAEGVAEGREEGREEGRGEAVLQVLTSRGLPLSEESTERVQGCRDQSLLKAWLDRALVVDSAEEIFD